jgi:hypothetical protein
MYNVKRNIIIVALGSAPTLGRDDDGNYRRHRSTAWQSVSRYTVSALCRHQLPIHCTLHPVVFAKMVTCHTQMAISRVVQPLLSKS